MAFNEALTTGQYDRLRSGGYAGTVNCSFFSGRIVFACQTVTDLTDPRIRAWWQFEYNNVTTGSYTDIEDGMTIIIGTTNDLKFSALQERLFHGRIRGEATSDVLPVNISSTPIPAGSYVWIVDYFEILNRLSRPVGAPPSVVQFKDTTLSYENMMPRVLGLKTCYGGDVDPITGKFRLPLDVSTFVEQVGETVTGYQYVFRDSIATVVSGSLSSPTVTVDIDPALCPTWGETWGTLNVTQSDGVVIVRKFGIKVHDPDHLPNVSFSGIQIRAGWQQNYTATLPAFAGVDDILPGTPALLWRSYEFYGAIPLVTTGGLTDSNIEFVGWFVSEDSSIKGDKDYSTVTDATFQLAGVGARLAYLVEQLLMIINQASPTVWDQIWFANPRRAVWHVLTRHSTAAVLCDVNFDVENLTEEFLFPAIPFKGTNILAVCNNLMGLVNGALEFAPDGRIFGCRDGQYLTADEFAALPIIGNFTAGIGAVSDGFVVAHSVSYDNPVGRVDFFGGTYNGQVIACKSRAPGMAQGEGQGSASVNDQILKAGDDTTAARTEINQRCGTYFAIANFVEKLTVDHGDGYNFLIPSKAEVYTWTINAEVVGPHGIDRIDFDTSTFWFVESVDYQPSNDGSRKVRVVYRRVILDAPPGQTPPSTPDLGITVPPITPIPFPSIPGLPPFPEAGLPTLPPGYKPSKGKITHLDGNTVIVSDNTNVWITQTYIALAHPIWTDITPSDLGTKTIREVIFDPLGPPTNTCGIYLVAANDTDSAIWYAPNALATPPDWTKHDDFSGTYTQIRGSDVAGEGLVYQPTGFDNSGHATITASLGIVSNLTPNFGEEFTVTGVFSSSFGGFYSFDITFDDCYSMKWVAGSLTARAQDAVAIQFQGCGGPQLVAGVNDGHPFTDFAGLAAINSHIGSAYPASSMHEQDGAGGPFTFILTNPNGDAKVRHFSDYGNTISSAIAVGAKPGTVGGFDLIRSGGVSYAAAAAEILKASTLGGSYSSFAASLGGNPLSACMPYFQVGSNTVRQTSSSSPQVVIGLDAVVGGTCLYYLDGSGTPTAITQPVSGATIQGPNKITMLRGTKIAVIVSVGPFTKLYEAQNLAADGTCTWTFVENVTPDATLRSRRNDNLTGTNKGQLLTFDDPCGYSSRWASASEWDRVSPTSGITSGDIFN